MKRHQCAALGMLVGCSLSVSMALGDAKPTAPTGVPPQELQAIQTSPAISAAQVATLDKGIASLIKDLTTGTPSAQAAARDALSNMANGAGTTSAYLEAYAIELNKALKPVAQNADARVRLNAAIVAAKVADRADNHRLAETALAFMQDKNEFVAMWGMKIAKGVMPALMRNPTLPQTSQVVQAIVPTAKARNSGYIVQDAYDALCSPANPSLTVPEVLALVQYRLQQYTTGIPAEPGAEAKAAFFLSDGKVWAAQSEAQKVQTVQVLTDLLHSAILRASGTKGGDQDQLTLAIARSASAMSVIGSSLNNAAISTAVTPLTKVGPGTNAAKMMADWDELNRVLRADPLFAKSLKAPPQINGAGQTTKPGTTTNIAQ